MINSNVRTITAEVVSASVQAAAEFRTDGSRNPNAGKYLIRCVTTSDVTNVNPTGRFYFTADQLQSLAANAGLRDFKTLLVALGKGDASMMFNAQFCKAGEVFVDANGIEQTYGEKNGGKDWWKIDAISTEFVFGDKSEAFIDNILTQLATSSEKDADVADRGRAEKARRNLLMMLNGSSKSTSNADPLDGPDDEEEFVDADVLADTKSGKGKK